MLIVYGWNTKKVETGFAWNVTETTARNEKDENGRYVNVVVIESGVKPTRSQAKGQAQKWVRYYKNKK